MRVAEQVSKLIRVTSVKRHDHNLDELTNAYKIRYSLSILDPGHRKTNSMFPKIVNGIVFAEEDIPCKTISKRERDANQNKNIPIIHKDPPGKLMSMPVKAEMHVP